MSGAQILVQTLIEQGVDVLFGLPGGYVLDIFDALSERQSEIRLIVPAHEQGGAHAADGYARVTGRAGVALATSGPGATNLVTGIANAYMDSIPMVAITGNVPLKPLNMMGRDSFQEIDICGVTMPITKHNFLVQDVSELAATVREAFTIAVSGRPGPVLIDIPKDVAAEVIEYASPGVYQKRAQKAPSADGLRRAADMLAKSERPLLFCGGGVISADAHDRLAALAVKSGAPVAATLMGLTALPSSHPLMLGMIGMHGTPSANYAGERCDLLISVGARFSDRVAGDRTRFAPKAKIVHIDIDPSEFDKNVVCDLHITGDAGAALETLETLVQPRSESHNNAWTDEIARFRADCDMPEPPEPERANPRGVLRAVSELAGGGAVIVTDVGQHQMWTAQYYPFTRPRGLITSGGLGAMGFGLGAAIGAKAAAVKTAAGDTPVVLVTGDGSFHMNLAELAAAVTENLPVIVVVMNNGVLGMLRQWQSMFHQGRYYGTDTNRATDYAKLCEAFGGLGFAAETMTEFRASFQKALDSGRVCVIDCRIDPDEKVFPMIPPGKSGKYIVYGD